jgi:hypothetical protein
MLVASLLCGDLVKDNFNVGKEAELIGSVSPLEAAQGQLKRCQFAWQPSDPPCDSLILVEDKGRTRNLMSAPSKIAKPRSSPMLAGVRPRPVRLGYVL